jgi:predicted Zn-ribbon and HTH transcriptional regulator
MNISDIYSRCKNCGYEFTDLSELTYCHNCQRAYDLGREASK